MELVESDLGLMGKIHNPDVLRHCVQLLDQLWKQIQTDGLNYGLDNRILEEIYGDHGKNRLSKDLYESYASEEERLRKGHASPEQCRTNILRGISDEIGRLSRDHGAWASVQATRTQLEIVCRNVPDEPGLDRLLRYEASLERSFERTLSQFERLQRMRLGQTVLPKLEVHHSVSRG